MLSQSTNRTRVSCCRRDIGADSIAAAMRFCKGTPTFAHSCDVRSRGDGVRRLRRYRRIWRFLDSELKTRLGVTLLPTGGIAEPRCGGRSTAGSGRCSRNVTGEGAVRRLPPVSAPMRVPVALRTDAVAVVSGEREWHGAGRSPTRARALDAYTAGCKRRRASRAYRPNVVERVEIERSWASVGSALPADGVRVSGN